MPRQRQYKYRDLLKKLKGHDEQFEEHKARGKGSERMLFHPDVDGEPQSYPLTCHGEGCEIRKGHLSAIVRRFKLPKKFFYD